MNSDETTSIMPRKSSGSVPGPALEPSWWVKILASRALQAGAIVVGAGLVAVAGWYARWSWDADRRIGSLEAREAIRDQRDGEFRGRVLDEIRGLRQELSGLRDVLTHGDQK